MRKKTVCHVNMRGICKAHGNFEMLCVLVIELNMEMAMPYFCGPIILLRLYRHCRIFFIMEGFW